MSGDAQNEMGLHQCFALGVIYILLSSFNVLLQKSKYHRSHSLGFKNGYAVQPRPTVGIGGVAIPYNELSEQELDELANYKPTLTYGQAKQAPPEDFVPAHVAWDKKVCFSSCTVNLLKFYLIFSCLFPYLSIR